MKNGLLNKTAIHILLIGILGVVIYSNTLRVPFVLDDFGYIVNNPSIKDFSYFLEPLKVLELSTLNLSFKYAFITRIAGYFTFAMNYQIHGIDVTGYHVFNIAVHILNAFLVYFLIITLFRTPFLSHLKSRYKPDTFITHKFFALLAALIFISHPVQTQAVTYITQRFTSLATFFFLLSLFAYMRSRLSGSQAVTYGLYGISLVSAIIAMMVKEISFTLPIIITLIEFLFFHGKYRRRFLLLLPFALTLLIIPSSLLIANSSFAIGDIDNPMKTLAANPDVSRWDYLLTQFRVMVTYIRLLFLPVHQNLDYDYPIYNTFFALPVFFSFIFLFFVFAFAIYLLYRSRNNALEGRGNLRLISFGILWFFITLSIESSIIPIKDVIFEHRLYLPSVGFIVALTTAISMMLHRIKSSPAAGSILGVTALVVFVWAGATYARNSVWHDNTTLWEDVVQKSPLKSRAHNNLGMAYEKQGRIDDAIHEYSAAVKLDPDYAHGHYNLGVMYDGQGRTKDAIEEYLVVIKLEYDNARAHNNLGVAYENLGRFDDAAREFSIAMRLDPDNANAHFNLGKFYYNQRRIDDAVREYQAAIKIDPDYAEAHINLGVIYSELGRTEDAVKEFLMASKINPDIINLHNNLGIMYGRQGRMEDAMKEFLTEIRINPNFDGAHYNLGVTYKMQGRFEEAWREFQKTLDLNPNHQGARNNLESMTLMKK